MKLKLALPVLGALALLAALPASAEARRRSSFDVSVGFGYSNHSHRGSHYRNYNRGYDSDVSFRYSRGYSRGHYGHGYRHYDHPRYYSPRPIHRDTHYYRPARRYYHHDSYYDRPVYRRYYDYDSYCY